MDLMEFSEVVVKEVEEMLASFGSREDGLSSQEVGVKRKEFGRNELANKEVGAWEILVRQLKSPFIYLLVVAAIVAWFLHEYSDTAMIIAFVLINTALGFYQEYKSAQTVKLLKKHLALVVRVKREGKEEEIASEEVVPGDIVMVEPGDIIPADMRLMKVEGLVVDESILTGESVVVSKVVERLNKALGIAEAKNMVFAGTTVVSGHGEGVVVATGKATGVGKITKLTAEAKSSGVFEQEIGRFSSFILKLVVATLVVIYVANLVIKGGSADSLEFALFAVALAVSVVPEALPVVATFSFSRGAMQLAKNKVVVKRLSAVEDLGSIEVLCTDKTGTLTENKMEVKEVWGDSKAVLTAAFMGVGHNNGKRIVNPFDLAIMAAANKKTAGEVVERVPFDPQRRRDSSLVKTAGGYKLIVRGAPETVMDLCDLKGKREVEKWMEEQGKLGRRVWAVAEKKLSSQTEKLEKQEKKMKLLGVIAFEDPIKKTSIEAIKQAQELGVRVVVLTGDKKEVAQAVAEKIGLVKEDAQVMSGDEWEKLSGKKKNEAISRVAVFCRVSPQQKYNLIQAIQESYHVGYLGDGINDAPALKLANVALAVKEASDIAREAADIVLLKKDLKVIIEGVRQGREIFANTTKYIKATLAANFGNFYAVAIASLLVDYLPMLPAQILLVNLLSDFPMIAVAADRVDEEELVTPRKFDIKEIVMLATILGIVSSLFDFMTFAIFSRMGEQILQTNWFVESIITELAFIYSIRTRKLFFKGTRPAGILIGLTAIAALATLVVPWLGVGQSLFGFVTPGMTSMLTVAALVVGYFMMTETVKLFYYRGK